MNVRRLVASPTTLAVAGLLALGPAAAFAKAPPSVVPPPKPVAAGDIVTPRSAPGFAFQTDLDTLAPLGTGMGNAAFFFKYFVAGAARHGAVQQAKRVARDTPQGLILYPDHPLLLEAEGWVDQATMAFYPDALLIGGYEVARPDFGLFELMARSWLARGANLRGPHPEAESRRVIRLGRLLLQEDVHVEQFAVGLRVLKMGLAELQVVGQREENQVLQTLTRNALSEIDRMAAKEPVAEAIAAVQSRRRPGDKPRFKDLHDSQVIALMTLASQPDLERRYRIDVIEALWPVLHGGTKEQKKRARSALVALSTGDPDEIVAREASWYLNRRWDPQAPILR